MKAREKRQSWRRTNRELHVLSRAGRGWVKALWQTSSAMADEDPRLGALATAVTAAIARSSGASAESDAAELDQARSVVIRAGYATRGVLARSTEQPPLREHRLGLPAGLDLRGAPDDPAAVDAATDAVRNLAASDFHSVMTLPPEVWEAYVVTATRAFQRALVSGSVGWRDLGRPIVDELLRCGYVLCCLDEALDQRAQPADSPSQ